MSVTYTKQPSQQEMGPAVQNSGSGPGVNMPMGASTSYATENVVKIAMSSGQNVLAGLAGSSQVTTGVGISSSIDTNSNNIKVFGGNPHGQIVPPVVSNVLFYMNHFQSYLCSMQAVWPKIAKCL